jgi:hypothetical protein
MKTRPLLSREEFRSSVLSRDNGDCVLCSVPARDAHHILERRLWPDGGYYVDNGASLCPSHHLAAERTDASVEALRLAARITRPILPPHLYDDQIYDKWANPILPNGQRLRGELFQDPSVQKILREAGKLSLFTHWVKYPRTYHLPWSQSIPKDDRVLDSLQPFHGKEIVVTLKMDGENTSLYNDHCHARSLDSAHHPSRSWVKDFWNSRRHDIPDQWRICGENLYATHSIQYAALPSYFMGFSVWNDHNICLSWKETLDWFHLLDIHPVQPVYQGIFDEKVIRALWRPAMAQTTEGYVLRLANRFHYSTFREHVAKFVRADHIQTTRHWMAGQRLQKNGLDKRS